MKRQKHILFLVSSMQGGGAERVAALLSNFWVENNYRVSLMPTFSGRGVCLYPLDKRVELEFLADRVGSTDQSLFNRLRRFWVLRKAINDIKPDIIISFLTHVNIAAILSAFGTRIPVIVSERTYPPGYPLGFFLTTLRKLTYPAASCVVMQTDQGMVWLKARVGKSSGVVIANPVEYPMALAEPMRHVKDVVGKNQRLCIAVGRLVEEKGFLELISAFSQLSERHPEWDLVILGEGPQRDALEKQITKLGCKGRVHLPGRAGNVAEWYSVAEVFIMNSTFEGFPNSLLEAMAYGLPVISTDCDTGPRDMISHGVNGLLLPASDNSLKLSQTIESVIEDPDFAVSLGTAAKMVRNQFALSMIGDKWMRLIETHMKKDNDG